jgi:phospholipid/cholesterol/gamma-HCH transport system substrate-binding protein
MNDRVIQFRVGVMVLATAIIAGILVVLFGDLPSLVQSTYVLRMNFSDARGVSSGTPVRKNGILVGRVSSVMLDERGGVSVTADIDSYVPVYRDETPRVASTILGDAEIELVAGRIVPPRQPVTSDEVLRGSVSKDPLSSFSALEPKVTASLESLTRASEAVAALSMNLEKTFVKDDIQLDRTVEKLDTALDTFTLAMNNVNDIVGDAQARKRLKDSINALPDVLVDLRESVGGISSTIETADRNLQNLEGLSKPLGERGESMVQGIDRAINRLDTVLVQAATFTQALNESQGTLGKLVRDPQVYNDLAQAAGNVNRLTQDLRPIIDDVRVFTDKIARHPEQLGVRGALDRRPGLK